MRLFLEKAQKLSQEWGSIPVMLAGDFNSMPKVSADFVLNVMGFHCNLFRFLPLLSQSAIYQFLASSEVSLIPEIYMCNFLSSLLL